MCQEAHLERKHMFKMYSESPLALRKEFEKEAWAAMIERLAAEPMRKIAARVLPVIAAPALAAA
jgi:hypothetical protein